MCCIAAADDVIFLLGVPVGNTVHRCRKKIVKKKNRKPNKTLVSLPIFLAQTLHLLCRIRQLVDFKKYHIVVGFKFHLEPGKHHGSYGSLCIKTRTWWTFSSCTEKQKQCVVSRNYLVGNWAPSLIGATSRRGSTYVCCRTWLLVFALCLF